MADDLADKEQQAIRAAVQQVAPSVVRIETIGGTERVGDVLFGTGPTTGLIVDRDGYVVSSVFNFVNRPASILVRLPDGSRKAARLVATDHSRMIVLLKVDAPQPLPVPSIAPESELRVGQWTIGIGRAFEADAPNVSVGILSAVGRIWGKALQTDAAVSPNNYGGPLVDLRGRVLGVLVPLSPESDAEVSGVEWYDSGIGFAIPAEHLWKILPRLKKGENLERGMMGVSFRSRDLYTEQPAISVVHPRSPADDAGIKSGDQIVEIEGRKVERAAQVREETNRRYAGDTIRLTVLRGKERLTRPVTLAAKLPPYEHPALGILPMRPLGEGKSAAGVAVRSVDADGPAARAGIQPGDVLVKFDEKPIEDRETLFEQIAQTRVDAPVKLTVRRGTQTLTPLVRLGRLPERLPPAELPPAHAPAAPDKESHPKLGAFKLKLSGDSLTAWACVPQSYQAAVAHGVVVWLHGPGEFDPQQFVAQWKPWCERHDLIVIAPKLSGRSDWQASDLRLVRRLLDEISVDYTLDATRVAVCGQGSGGTLALAAAFRLRDMVRAAAAIDSAPADKFPPTDPATRTALYVASAERSKFAPETQESVARLREAGYPVTIKELGMLPRDLTPDELAELARWIDTLDRM